MFGKNESGAYGGGKKERSASGGESGISTEIHQRKQVKSNGQGVPVAAPLETTTVGNQKKRKETGNKKSSWFAEKYFWEMKILVK